MTLLLVLTYIVAFPVLVYAVNSLNSMDRHTKHGIRFGYILITCSAMSAMLGPIWGKGPDWTTLFILIGCLMLFIFNKQKFLCEVPYAEHLRKS